MAMILFDGTAFQSSKRASFHGGGEYAKFILKSAVEEGYLFDVVLSNKLFLDEQTENFLAEHKEIKTYRVDSKQQIYQLIENQHYQTFYSALPASYSNYKCKAKLIGVIHGLRAAELPWDFYRYKYEAKWRKRLLAWTISHCPYVQTYLKNKHIIHNRRLLNIENAVFFTASYHTKYALLSFYPELKAEHIQVFYSPFSVQQIKLSEPKSDYFLMVSGNRYEKNVYRAVKVFDKLFSDGRLKDKRVVITGCSNQPFWSELVNRKRFELLPYISTEELEQLYKNAFCFVYPSLNEGFGYPPLKAMSYGTPVIASSATSIPEVCDDAACYFNPTNLDDLAVRILRINNDVDYRTMLVKRGLKNVKELQDKQRVEVQKYLEVIFKQQSL